jgi:hypothetical protein
VHRYFRHTIDSTLSPNEALHSVVGASVIIVRVDNRGDKTDVTVATSDKAYHELSSKSALGVGAELREDDVLKLGE